MIASIGFSQIPTNGLVAHYPFNGNANDESGNGNNGTVNGATLTEDRFGNINSAYKFDGVNDYIKIGNSSLKNSTISLWFNINSYPDKDSKDYNTLITNVNQSQNLTGLTLQINDDSILGASYGNNSIWKEFNAGNIDVLCANKKWCHLILISDSITKESKIFLNGELKNTLSNNANFIETEFEKILLGARYYMSKYDFFHDGDIDDIKIYDRVLTECEVKALYNENDTKLKVTVQDTLNIYLSQIITTVYTPSSAATTVKVYPNPTSKNLTVEIDNPNNLSGVTIKVMDAQSSVVHNEFVTGSTQSIDVSNWSSGIYFLHIINGNTTVDVRKIVVNN